LVLRFFLPPRRGQPKISPGQRPGKRAGGIREPRVLDPGKDKERYKDYRITTISNSLWTEDKRLVNREAILYKDGTVKLWSFETHAPIGEPLRHKGPIRDLEFFDLANLLVTVSDDTMKFWQAASGKPRGEIEAARNPVFSESDSARAGRFVTIDPGRQLVWLRDAATFKPVGTVKSQASTILGAALTDDGGTLVTFTNGRTIELRHLATSRVFATLRPPSLVTKVFGEDNTSIEGGKLHRMGGFGERFWAIVGSLGPEVHDASQKRQRSPLFLIDDPPADFPVGRRHDGVGGAGGDAAG
jgi:hypothetical protein